MERRKELYKINMIVYRHRRLDTNEVFYVGIGTSKYRATDKTRRSKFWKRVVSKTDYSVEIIAEVDTWEDACELEQFLIQEYGRRDLGLGPLVNMTDGGEGRINAVVSDETRKKISEAKKGHKHSEETKAKMSEANKNPTEETRLKMSLAKKGHIPWNKGTKGIMTFPNRIKTSRGYKVLNTETNEIYPSILSASKAININCETLRQQLLGKYKNKTTFKIINNEIK